uniref:Uncharacterized protein n=1 Tax=Zonotrichia albicollis TaxID=44394 RepID=A0A8D2MB21_ZONAL
EGRDCGEGREPGGSDPRGNKIQNTTEQIPRNLPRYSFIIPSLTWEAPEGVRLHGQCRQQLDLVGCGSFHPEAPQVDPLQRAGGQQNP